MRIGDRVIFKPYGDKNPDNWLHGVIVAPGYGPSGGDDHVFVRYDKTNRTNATAVKALTVDEKGQTIDEN
ncbi:MAG: hypothetical protein J3T61_11105 [Candidatus Brocadiales bacterium]|nr:hypothetical protein [Candidatus Bathyanammoxibius sp.]